MIFSNTINFIKGGKKQLNMNPQNLIDDLVKENKELKTKLAEAELKVAELQAWHDSHM